MLEGDKSCGDISCMLPGADRIHKLPCGCRIGVCPFSPDRDMILTMLRSDIAKIKEEANAIAVLKSEQCSYHERSLKNAGLLVDLSKNFSIDNTGINVSAPSPVGKDIIAVVKSDLEQLKDEMNDIAMLKSELWSYQINISHKINSLQKPAYDH